MSYIPDMLGFAAHSVESPKHCQLLCSQQPAGAPGLEGLSKCLERRHTTASSPQPRPATAKLQRWACDTKDGASSVAALAVTTQLNVFSSAAAA